jgi:hypothetical protein
MNVFMTVRSMLRFELLKVISAGGRYFFAGAFPAATGLRSNAQLLSTKNTQSEALSHEVVWR